MTHSTVQRQLSWPVVIAFGILGIVLIESAPTATQALIARGTPPVLATAAVFLAWGVATLLLLLIGRRHNTSHPFRFRLKVGAFLIVTVTLLGTTQFLLAQLLASYGVAPEIQWYGSWLSACLVVGLPADAIRKRLGIPFPRNDMPAN